MLQFYGETLQLAKSFAPLIITAALGGLPRPQRDSG